MDAPTMVSTLAVWLPILIWVVWWLLAVNWKRFWPVLAQGGWAPAVLLLVMAAIVWSRLQPGPCPYFGHAPNFVWQFAVMTALGALALLCGWMQGRLGWQPGEVSIEPPAAEDDGHGNHH